MNVRLMLLDTALPVVATLTVFLCAPYCLSESVGPYFVEGSKLVLVKRHIYPVLSLVTIFFLIGWLQFSQLTRLYERIKNDKYLVGRQLVNYYHRERTPKPEEEKPSTESTEPVASDANDADTKHDAAAESSDDTSSAVDSKGLPASDFGVSSSDFGASTSSMSSTSTQDSLHSLDPREDRGDPILAL